MAFIYKCHLRTSKLFRWEDLQDRNLILKRLKKKRRREISFLLILSAFHGIVVLIIIHKLEESFFIQNGQDQEQGRREDKKFQTGLKKLQFYTLTWGFHTVAAFRPLSKQPIKQNTVFWYRSQNKRSASVCLNKVSQFPGNQGGEHSRQRLVCMKCRSEKGELKTVTCKGH